MKQEADVKFYNFDESLRDVHCQGVRISSLELCFDVSAQDSPPRIAHALDQETASEH